MSITQLIEQGAIFYISHSGGKDSQAMYALMLLIIPHSQIVVVHADLGEVEHLGVKTHIIDTIDHELNVTSAVWADGSEKNLLNMVERRFEQRPTAPSWPSAAMRYCTSDLKRDPIAKFIRGDLKQRGGCLAVNCTGIRAEESTARSKKTPFAVNKRLSNKSRTVYDWMPIFDLTTAQVFKVIAAAGQQPFWMYKEGNERLSCVFCILGSPNDLRNGARIRPELAARYEALEVKTGYSMFNGKTLAEKMIIIEAG